MRLGDATRDRQLAPNSLGFPAARGFGANEGLTENAARIPGLSSGGRLSTCFSMLRPPIPVVSMNISFETGSGGRA